YDLPGAKVQVETPFISLWLTPLDNEVLGKSKRILVTAMARDKQKGAEFNADWSQMSKRGVPPLMMEPVQAKITLVGGRPKSVRACDIYGVPKGKPLAVAADGTFAIDGTAASYYYYIER
ncbi:MAG: hypothetical protein HRU15_06685, partial [Planctomycetes bacterium]|nr:hypothetical protein [Planctomycetota bacterium]